MQYRIIFAASLAFASSALASPARPQITKAPRAARNKRQQPDPAGSSVLDAPMTIAAGEAFDGGDAVFDRGVDCSGQEEGGSDDAVFVLENGASLSNVIIGPNQIEGVHCQGSCTINNVWWDAVCEDAFSIKEQGDDETTTINGGGATGAEDKVIQHNGGGTVIINDFTVSDFGKLYRSCGNCDEMPARHVQIVGGSATNGDMLVGINSNMGDTASISGISTSGVEDQCTDFEGVVGDGEPEEIGPCANVGSSDGGSGEQPEVSVSVTQTPSATTPSAPTQTEDEPAETTTAADEGDEEEEEEEDETDEDEDEDQEDEDEQDEEEEEEDEEESDEGEESDEVKEE